ncbi:MAG: DNA gyrase subunit B [Clostridia bacterium]
MKEYSAKDIRVLEGLEAVRLRPGMYIGTTGSKGLHHILWEIVDNSIDELSNKFGDTINIEIYKDNSISVFDNGRGIPPDIHPDLKVSGIEVVFTQLHAGAKFDNQDYTFSGGLHGVGSAVTNALSKWLKVVVYQKGKAYSQDFESYIKDGKYKCGVPIHNELQVSPCAKTKTGTFVQFLPDEDVFKKETFSYNVIEKKIRELCFLNCGITITLKDNRTEDENGNPMYVEFHFDGGLKDFVSYLNEGKIPLFQMPALIENTIDKFQYQASFQYTDDYNENIISYVNNIPTTEGGTHEAAFKTAYTKVLNDYARANNILKEKDDNFFGEDFREGLTLIISVKMQNVQFEGQTKTKLGNPEVKNILENAVYNDLMDFLKKAKKDVIDAIYLKAQGAAKVRIDTRKAKMLSRQKNSIFNTSLIGKLSPCSGKKAEINELFIVEGDSAGGSAKQGRDRHFQAILPLRGKPLNVEKKKLDKVLANEEIASIINALGAGFGEDFNIEDLKYSKIVILADADQDGAHIRAILLTFFFRYMRKLITNGNVYIGMPPLYKIEAKGKITYAYDDIQLEELLQTAPRGYALQRYKGLGEMNPEQLWETTLNPETRSFTRVSIDDIADAEKMITTLMGDDIDSRKKYINTYANFNKVDKYEKLGE